MFFNPIIGILHNAKENKWHPIVFVESPLPGPDEPGKPVRHRSKMHHTGGFATREEAVANASGDIKAKIEGAKLALEEDIEWDGDGTPALTAFFAGSDSGLRRVL